MRHKMVGGRVLITDSTHLKANANKRKHDTHEVQVGTKENIQQLDDAIGEDREEHGKKL